MPGSTHRTETSDGLSKLGGLSLAASGILFLSAYSLDLIAGPPPSSGFEILAWVASRKPLLIAANEMLLFAVMFLVPAVIALAASLGRTERVKAAVGCGMIAALIPTLIVLVIVHGRLIFPVFGIQISPAAAELAVAVFYGGLHAVDIVFGVATIVLGLAIKRGGYGTWLGYLGIVTGLADFVAAYSWLVGAVPLLLARVLFAGWFVAVGARLYTSRWSRPAGR